MDARGWDERYAAAQQDATLVWSPTPNSTIAQLTGQLAPGRALDLAAGEGRNAIWLAERGWSVTAVDFSPVATARMRQLAGTRLGERAGQLTVVTADVLAWDPGQAIFDLVIIVFLHLPPPQRLLAHRRAAAVVAPGGQLIVLAHDRSNLTDGVGGPQDPAVLPTPQDVVADLAHTGLQVDRAEVIIREVVVEGVARHARDTLVVAQRR